MKRTCAAALCMSVLVAGTLAIAHAGDFATAAEAEAMVKKAVTLVKAERSGARASPWRANRTPG